MALGMKMKSPDEGCGNGLDIAMEERQQAKTRQKGENTLGGLEKGNGPEAA